MRGARLTRGKERGGGESDELREWEGVSSSSSKRERKCNDEGDACKSAGASSSASASASAITSAIEGVCKCMRKRRCKSTRERNSKRT